MKFDEFLHFLADNGVKSAVEPHWASFCQLCSPCEVKYKYIAKLETIEEDFSQIMKAVNGTQIEYPKNTLGPHSTQEKDPKEVLKEYYSEVNKTTLARIRDLYAADFELFGYDTHIEGVEF